MQDWKKVLLTPRDPISRVIEILDKEAPRIVLVVDQTNRLLGTVTDGDVRRGLLRHYDLNTPVKKIMYRHPRVAGVNTAKKDVLEKMQRLRINQIPIVDTDGIVVGLEVYKQLVQPTKYDNPVFLVAGGFGKRLRPLTLSTPKPLLKVKGKPLLKSIVENFARAGFHRFFISIHYKGDQVKTQIGDGSEWSVDVEYLHEKAPLGTAGALGLLPDDMPDLPLVVMNGDLVTQVNFGQLIDYHVETGGCATMCVRSYELQLPYGVVDPVGHRVMKIEEKPIQRLFVNAGIYVLDPKIYRHVNADQYLNMPDLLQYHLQAGTEINMFPIHEYWLDIGQLDDFQRAQRDVVASD